MGYSPPIATRSGWISFAILPFLLYVSRSTSHRSSAKVLTLEKGIRNQSQLYRRLSGRVAREVAGLPPLVCVDHVYVCALHHDACLCQGLKFRRRHYFAHPHVPVHRPEHPDGYDDGRLEHYAVLLDWRRCACASGMSSHLQARRADGLCIFLCTRRGWYSCLGVLLGMIDTPVSDS